MGNAASPLTSGSLTQLSLSLLLIVGLIFAIAWLLKRFRITVPRGSGDIAIVDQLALTPRDRILLVRVGDAQLLVGVGAAGIVSLTPLATPIAQLPSAPTPVFAARLRDLMKRPGSSS